MEEYSELHLNLTLWSLGITFFSLFFNIFSPFGLERNLQQTVGCFVLDDGVDDEMMIVLCCV